MIVMLSVSSTNSDTDVALAPRGPVYRGVWRAGARATEAATRGSLRSGIRKSRRIFTLNVINLILTKLFAIIHVSTFSFKQVLFKSNKKDGGNR